MAGRWAVGENKQWPDLQTAVAYFASTLPQMVAVYARAGALCRGKFMEKRMSRSTTALIAAVIVTLFGSATFAQAPQPDAPSQSPAAASQTEAPRPAPSAREQKREMRRAARKEARLKCRAEAKQQNLRREARKDFIKRCSRK